MSDEAKVTMSGPDYDEFDDVERMGKSGLIVKSEKAWEATCALAREYRMTYDPNPGGAEFNTTTKSPISLRCQIHDYDDIENLYFLRRAIAKAIEDNQPLPEPQP